MLGELISNVFGSLLPVQAELFYYYLAAHPVESHVKGLGAVPAHVAIEDAVGGCAVGLDRGGQLRMSHIGEGCADGDSLMVVEKNCTGFCFRGGSHDNADGLTFGEYWTIRGRSWKNVVVCSIDPTT